MEGEGDLFLSNVLDTNRFQKGVFNLIDAPCGSGKTTAAIEKIAPLASSFDRAIYLIDTKLGKDRLALNKKLTTPYKEYADDVSKHFFALENEGKICVTTYAQFGYWCFRFGMEFPDYFEYIICDEPQNLVAFSEMGQKEKSDIPCHKWARWAIGRAVWTGKSYVIGITATPELLERLRLPMNDIPIDRTNLHHYTEKCVRKYASLESVLETLNPNQRGGIYITNITPMIEKEALLRARGHNPLLLWSLKNTDHKLSQEQLDARQYIIENEEVPPQYNIFMFNATAETSINIRPTRKWDFFIANNPNPTTITQSRGRYRGDLPILYVRDYDGEVVVPDDCLNRWMTIQQMEEMRDNRLKLKKDKHGNPPSVKRLKEMLNQNGYRVEDGFNSQGKKTFKIRRA